MKPVILPSECADYFDYSPEGELQATFTSAVQCREVEIALAMARMSYRTQLVRSRKNGNRYVLTVYA